MRRSKHHEPPNVCRDITQNERRFTAIQEHFGMGKPDPVLDILNKILAVLVQIRERGR